MTKPLPCPFCGAYAKVRKLFGAWDCYCVRFACEIRPATTLHSTREEAVAAWNRRAK